MKRLCPDCKVEGWRYLLRLIAGPWLTPQVGTLRYWRCRVCKEVYVTCNNGTAEVAA